MDPMIGLLQFYFDEFSVKWAGEYPKVADLAYRYSMDYETWANDEHERLFKLQLVLRVEPESADSAGYTIESRITGIFELPEGLAVENMPAILRMNGSSILYGILRGQIAGHTGLCPAGVFTLPTIDMKNAIERIEQAKSEKSAELAQAKKRSAKNIKSDTSKKLPKPARAQRKIDA